MEPYILLYKIKAVDEFNRHYESYARIDAQYLIIKEQADDIYFQMMVALLTDILLKMGSDAKADWTVEVEEEISLTISI